MPPAFLLAEETKVQSGQGALVWSQILSQEFQAPNHLFCPTQSTLQRGLANLPCKADFSRNCAVIFTGYFVAKIILSYVKSLCVDFPQNSTVCHYPEAVWWRGLSQLPGFSHKSLDKCQKFSLVSKHYQWEKKPKRTRKAALGDGRFSNSCFNKALILIKASSIFWSLQYQHNQKNGSQCFQFLFCPASPAPQEVKINNQ